MKCKTVKSEFGRIQCILLALFTLCFASCRDEEEKQIEPYDPSKPVEITDSLQTLVVEILTLLYMVRTLELIHHY